MASGAEGGAADCTEKHYADASSGKLTCHPYYNFARQPLITAHRALSSPYTPGDQNPPVWKYFVHPRN